MGPRGDVILFPPTFLFQGCIFLSPPAPESPLLNQSVLVLSKLLSLLELTPSCSDFTD